ncbi:MAG: glycosyltransferase family 2 protein [Akkermansiaceae bacterium]|nr:glycosyltransferase family 2 protein [Akkermansiaceae bacterium]
MQSLISIIVPVYNTAPYLRRCLDSLKNQTYSKLEIICVNDGSTDNSLDILNEYARQDSRFIIKTTKNYGLAAARNIGLNLANGQWVTGVDSDDYIDADTCEYIMSYAYADVNVIQYGLREVLEEESTKALIDLRRRNGHSYGKHIVTPLILINQPCEFCSKFWRKSFLDKHRCRFPDGCWYEDWFFYWAYMPLAKCVLCLPECKYVYLRRKTSIMGLTQKKSEKSIDHIYVLKQLIQYREENSLPKVFSCLNILNFLSCQYFINKNLPAHLSTAAQEEMRIIASSSLFNSWRIWLKYLKPHSFFSTLFIKYIPGKIYLKFFGMNIFFVHLEWDKLVVRMLGKRIFRKRLW